jgi:hypothetical protein
LSFFPLLDEFRQLRSLIVTGAPTMFEWLH